MWKLAPAGGLCLTAVLVRQRSVERGAWSTRRNAGRWQRHWRNVSWRTGGRDAVMDSLETAGQRGGSVGGLHGRWAGAFTCAGMRLLLAMRPSEAARTQPFGNLKTCRRVSLSAETAELLVLGWGTLHAGS